MMEAENVRRDRIRDVIKNIPEGKREDAGKAEEERKRQWDEARAKYLERQCSPGSSQTKSAAESSLPLNDKRQHGKRYFSWFFLQDLR
jgi:hypothetical protein